jgi:hypothetical protein
MTLPDGSVIWTSQLAQGSPPCVTNIVMLAPTEPVPGALRLVATHLLFAHTWPWEHDGQLGSVPHW